MTGRSPRTHCGSEPANNATDRRPVNAIPESCGQIPAGRPPFAGSLVPRRILARATEHPYLAAVLPAARRFLLAHQDHELVFGDSESLMNFDEPAHLHLKWLDEASLDEPSLQALCLDPRYFAEHPAFRYSSWEWRSIAGCTTANSPETG